MGRDGTARILVLAEGSCCRVIHRTSTRTAMNRANLLDSVLLPIRTGDECIPGKCRCGTVFHVKHNMNPTPHPQASPEAELSEEFSDQQT